MDFRHSKKNQLSLLIMICILLSFSLLKIKPGFCEWTINPAEEISYVVEEAEWSIAFNNEDGSGKGGKIRNLTFKEGSTFSIEVTNVSEIWGIDYKIKNSTSTTNYFYDSTMFITGFSKLLYYPQEECKRIIEQYSIKPDIIYGPPLLPWFFIEDNSEVFNFLNEVTKSNYHSSIDRNETYEATMESDFENLEDIVKIDFYMNGYFSNESFNTDINFDHNLKFVWNKTSGILLGYRVQSQFEGTYRDNTISESLSLIIRKSGYILPEFKFGVLTGFLPGFTFSIVLSSILISTMTHFLRKKKKKGN
ncbi:MAG: choice-of-anchor S family protein [Asgard group archaeon]|nr:choice-of-anchor S family protein [Asgard group archaeon]